MKLTQKLLKQYKNGDKKMRGQIIPEYCRLTEISKNTASKRFRKQIKNIYPQALPSTANVSKEQK